VGALASVATTAQIHSEWIVVNPDITPFLAVAQFGPQSQLSKMGQIFSAVEGYFNKWPN